jgi:hypothetical protein
LRVHIMSWNTLPGEQMFVVIARKTRLQSKRKCAQDAMLFIIALGIAKWPTTLITWRSVSGCRIQW